MPRYANEEVRNKKVPKRIPTTDQPTKKDTSMEPQSETSMNIARPTKAVPANEKIVLECSTMALIQLFSRAI
jgi:hypothetical protein